MTTGPRSTARPLPYADPAHQAAHQFLVEEAALLDAADYAGWLDLLCEDIRYLMPVRVTTARGAGYDALLALDWLRNSSSRRSALSTGAIGYAGG